METKQTFGVAPQIEERKTNDSLGKDDFLKLLITQLANQDPLNPMEDRDFIAQMAQFSALEQMTNMSIAMEKLALMQEQAALMSYNQFLGKQVTWHKIIETDEESESLDNKFLEGTGVVKKIEFKDGTAEFLLDDGTILTPANISDVKNYAPDSPLIQASYLIGKKVAWFDDEEQLNEKDGTVTSVSVKDGTTWLHFSNGGKVNADKVVKVES